MSKDENIVDILERLEERINMGIIPKVHDLIVRMEKFEADIFRLEKLIIGTMFMAEIKKPNEEKKASDA